MTVDDLWTLCVDPDAQRYDLSKPFVRDGWRYATNGSICIRIRVEGEPDSTDGKYPKADELFKGFGRCTRKWPKPTGVGEVVQCPECGEDYVAYPTEVVGIRRIAAKYADPLYECGAMFRPKGGADELLMFQIGEIQGIVMPKGKHSDD